MKRLFITIILDGEKLTIAKSYYDFLKILACEGFYREISADEFISQERERYNPLWGSDLNHHSGYIDQCTRVDLESICHAFVVDLSSDCKSDSQFLASHLLSSMLTLYFPIKRMCPRLSEAKESDSVGWESARGITSRRRGRKSKSKARIEEPTAGSKFLEEDNRNELHKRKKTVKKKIKKTIIIDEENLSVDNEREEELEILSKDWLDWSLGKMPWFKEKFKPEDFYEALITIRNTTELNNVGLKALFEFIRKDDFWQNQAISPRSLLTKSRNSLRKIDNVLIKMQKEMKRKQPFHQTEEWKPPF